MARSIDNSWKNSSWQFWLLSAFLVFIFFTGGSSRGDVQSLAVLRPASMLVLGIGIISLRQDDLKRYRMLVAFAVAVMSLVALYLLPLSHTLLQAFPAFEMVQMTEKLAASGSALRPAATVPMQAWNGFYSLFVPLAVLTLTMQLDRQDLLRLLLPLLIFALISGLVGFLQILGSSDGPLYFYRLTNNGDAVGFFANRNHQAVLLSMLFPILAVFASSGIKSTEQRVFRGWLAISGGIFLIPLILVTGSRAGLVLGLIALIAALTIYRKPEGLTPPKRKGRTINWRIPLTGLGIAALGLISMLMSRAKAIDRLIAGNDAQDQRIEFWSPVARMAKHDLPFGAGPGGIAETYAQIEPLGSLNITYLNRAHNDWLETFSSFGWLGIALLLAAIIAIIVHSRSVFTAKNLGSRQAIYSKLGLLMIVLAAIGSIADYPLRTPILSAVFVIAVTWFAFAPRAEKVVV